MFRLDLGKYSTNGGSLSPSLAAILYQTSLGDFVYQTDSNGNVILDNQGTLTSAYDGLPYSGRGIELGALNDVEFPIHHTLGVEEGIDISFDTIWTVAGESTSTGNGEVNLLSTDASYSRVALLSGFSYTDNVYYLFEADASGYDGEDFTLFFGGTINSAGVVTVSNGKASIVFNSGVGADRIDLVRSGITNIVFTDYTLKQITNPNSYLTYYDFTDGLVTLGNSVDGGSSEELSVNGTFDADTDWTKAGLWTISGGTANANGEPAASILQVANTVVGRYYALTFTVSGYTSGTVIPHIGGTNLGNITANGTYTVYKTATAITQAIEFYSASAILSIDNVSFTEILPISTKYPLNTKTVNNVLKHATNWSPTARAKVENNPNLIGKLALETLGATKTIPELDMVMDAGASADSYYMCSEKSGAYLVDSRVAYGSELSTGGATPNVSWTIVKGSSIAGGILSLNYVGTGELAYMKIGNTIPVGVYIAEVIVTNYVSGAFSFRVPGATSGSISANGTYTILLKKTSTVGNDFGVFAEGTGVVADITYASLKSVSAQDIASYADTVRSNADLQQKGIQTTAFVTDGAGVPTAYSSNLLQFNGDGRYVDTGFMPPSDSAWTIELAMETISDATWKINGIFGALTENTLFIGQTTVNTLRAKIGDQQMTTVAVPSDGIHHILLTFDGAGAGSFYIDGVSSATYALSTYAYVTTESFFLGSPSTSGTYISGYDMTTPLKVFKHHNKLLNTTEVAKAYADFLTLP